MREKITQLVTAIPPYDSQEKEHKADVISWIQSCADLFRIQKPDVPPKHLVSYIVLIDIQKKKLLLIHHNKARLLLPPGGHVEPHEHPTETVKRELQEELHLEATFIKDAPFFITVTETINSEREHTDVSLWYLLAANATKPITYDPREIRDYAWLSYEEVLQLDKKKTDPHMYRFMHKLRQASLI